MTIMRKMKKSEFFGMRSLFAGLFGALALIFVFASCDTGLGESIDTSVPVVTVSSPESGAVLSGTVNISGSCTDDKAVARVAVTVTNTLTGVQAGVYNAAIVGNTWTLAVKNLTDGTYSANAICYDAAGRQSGVASRVFDVDSTPPVFCVTKPNSLSITDPAAYGRDVTIKGEIADDHAVKQMDIRVFKVQGGAATEITSSLRKATFSGFETAGGTEVTIAKFFPDSEIPPATSDDYPLYLNYKAMYSDLGAQVGDTVNLYIFPYLTDAAGNVSDKCYIQSSLKQLTAKACNVDTTSDSLQTAQFKKILNGSYSLGEVDVETVKTILYGDYDQSSIGTNYLYYACLPQGQAPAVSANSPLAMSVNANNSPMYEFGGFSVDRNDLVFAEVANKGTISVKVSAGLDGNEIFANTVRVYLWECSDTLNLRPGANLNILSTASYSSDNDDAAKAFKVYDSEQNEVKDLPDSTKVSTATYKIVLPDNLSAGVHYLMTAGGVDVAGNKFYSTGTYAFMVATTGDAPKVDFGDQFFINARAIDKTQSAGYKATVQITDKTGSGSIPEGEGTMQEEGNWVKVRLSLYKGYAKTKGYLSDSDLLQGPKEIILSGSSRIKKNGPGDFYVEIPMNEFDLTGANKADNYTVAMQVQAKNIGATSEATTYIFWADAAPPALAVTAPAREPGTSESVPIYIFETDKNINETTPTGAAAKTYEYTKRGTWSDISGSGTSEIFCAWDAPASPAFSWTPSAGTAVEGVTYYTKQAGDGATGLYLADTGIKAGDSVAGKYTLSLGGEWTAISGAPKSVSKANWNQSAPAVNSSGRTLNVVAVDQTGNMSAVTKVSNIMFDFAAPLVTAPVVKEYYTKADASEGKYPFVINVLDESGLKSLDVTAKKYNAVTKAYEPVTPGASGYTLVIADDKTKATITLKDDATSDGKWQFGSVATDKAMRVGTAEFAFTIDTVPPERAYQYTNSDASKNRMITIGAEGSDSDWHNSENLAIKGKYKEWTSGLDRVDYTVTPPSPATPVDGSEAVGGLVSSAAGDVAYTLSPIGFKEGSNSIAIKGVDLAGNASTSETYTINIDTTAPLVNTAYYTYDGVNLTEAAGTVMSNGLLDMTVFGTLDEKLSGIKSLVLKMNNAVVSGDVLYTKDSITGMDSYIDSGTAWASYNSADNKAYTGFKATIDKSKLSGITGDVDLYAVATDIAGNVTEQRKFMIHIDTDAPVISVMSPDVNAVVNGSVTFTGAVDDPALNGVQAYWSFDSSETIDPSRAANPDHEIVDGSGTALLDGTYSWNIRNYAMSVVDNASDKITFVDGSEYEGTSKDVYIKILARDKAANQAVKASKYTIDPNGDRPKIILTSGALSGMSPTNYVPYGQQKLEGAIEDDDGITKLECSYKAQDAADWSAWDDITSSISGGAWSFDVPADNKYAVRFRVTDKSGAVFESTKTGEKNIYLSPVIAGTDATFSTDDTYLYLQVDTKRPEYSDLAYSTSDSASGTYTPTALPEKLGVVGGQKKFVKMNFYAKDDNGINSVSLTLNGVKYDGTLVAYDIVNKRYSYEISAVDVSGLLSDVYAAKLEIKGSFESDVTTENIAFTVDNTPPAVNPLSPDENQVHGLVTVYGTVDGSNSMKYALSLSESEKPADGDYKGIAGVGNTWFVYLDGGVSTLEESHDITLESYIIAKHVKAIIKGVEVEATEENIRNQSFDAIVPIYIWIKAVDDVGNIYEKPHQIKFDPQGGRPSVTFGNPEANEARVGGEVKLYGGSDCDEGEVKAVFLQIISAQHNKDATTTPPYTGGTTWGTATYSGGKVTVFEPSANDMDYLKAMGYKVVKMRDYPTTETIWDGSGNASDYGVVADFKGGAWSLRINGSGEFNPKVGESGTNQLIVCAYAYNGSKMNLPQYRQMLVDADSPTISDMFIKQYDGSVLAASKAYTNGVYVKGASNLEFDLKDGDDIAKVFIGKSDESAAKAKDDAAAQKAADTTPDDHKVIPSEVTGSAGNYHAKIALATASGVGGKYLYVIFADMKGNSGTQAFNINYDNVQPAVASTNIPTDVHNSDGYYSVEAKVTEAVYDNHNQSGFERFVVYFKRGNKVFDPMISKKKSGAANPDNWVDVSGMTVTDGLYWAQKTVEREAANLNVIKLSSGDASAHIHAGRLVKIGGAYYRITGVTDGSGDEKLITLDGQVEESFTTAYFAYGESVDNNKKETGNGHTSWVDGYGYGYPTSIANDDGDLMEEWANIQGTTCNLSAKINSRNIPDGSVEIYYSVFDKAGNVTTGSVTGAYVSNNAPRLANVIVASDHNYNGVYTDAGESRAKFTDSEKPSDWANAYKALDLGSENHPWISAKGATRVTPEILGGNGALTWTCKYAGSADPSAAQALSTDTPLVENEKRTVNTIVLDEISLKGAAAGTGLYEINVLDSTEGGAQKAVISLWMKNDVRDTENPVAKTKRFYWKSLTNNSVYGSSAAKSHADLQGHIELEDQATFGDKRPKVSGKIVIKGTAFDNSGIKKINITVPGLLNTATKAAECDLTNIDLATRWTQTALGNLATDGYHFALDADEGGNVKERYTNTGHFVSWTLELDTEKAKFDAAGLPAKNNVDFVLEIVDKNDKASSATTNPAITVYATDEQAAKGKYYAEERFAAADESEGFVAADYNADEFSDITAPADSDTPGVNKYVDSMPVAPNYTMDIVPYITSVKTSLSAVDATNGVTDRSSLGAYPVYVYKNSTATAQDVSVKAADDKESVKVYGFNLNGAKYGAASLPYTDGYVSVDSDTITPGAFALTVNGVDTLNNSNNNNAKGSYTTATEIEAGGTYSVYKHYYNRQPNNANNNNLTDDVAFDVWQLNNMAAAPMAGSADDPQMKIQPYVTKDNAITGGKVGFAFSNGSSAFTMPNNTYSWTYWAYDYDRVRYVGLSYDPQGYAWAAASGQDTHGDGGDPFFMETTRNRQRGGNGDEDHVYGDVTDYSKWKLERICIGNKNQIMQDRIQSPSFANTTSGVYLAYYYVGSTKAEIRFRAGKSASAASGNTFDFFTNDGNAPISTYTTNNVQLVAGGTGDASNNAAPYVSIAAVDGGGTIADDVVVMVWHDGSKMLYGYLTDPSNTSRKGNTTAAGWTIKEIFPAGVTGEYCKIAVDKQEGVHIAAYDSNDANVWYAYLPKYDAAAKVAKVDTYDSTGVYLTLDAALDANNNPAPQIGFYSMASNRPKYARWNAAKGSLASAKSVDGADSNDSYTGNWEVSNIPTVSNVRKSNTASKVKQNVNVGVWKDGDGKVTTSKTGNSYCIGSATGGTSGLAANNKGDVYGNGTKNAVLSYTYGTDSSAFIETAQRLGNND